MIYKIQFIMSFVFTFWYKFETKLEWNRKIIRKLRIVMRNLCINCVFDLFLVFFFCSCILALQLCTSSHRYRKCCVGHTLSLALFFSFASLIAHFLWTICISVWECMYMCVCVCVNVCVFVWYSPTIDLASIGRCQGRHIELYRRIGSFQSICLVQLLHDVFHFPNAFQIE